MTLPLVLNQRLDMISQCHAEQLMTVFRKWAFLKRICLLFKLIRPFNSIIIINYLCKVKKPSTWWNLQTMTIKCQHLMMMLIKRNKKTSYRMLSLHMISLKLISHLTKRSLLNLQLSWQKYHLLVREIRLYQALLESK